jgi:hypothetical protein
MTIAIGASLFAARTNLRKQLADDFFITKSIESQATIGNTINLCERNQRLNHSA